jgi:uncharacterized protein YgiM (DUF1202 family)
MNRRVVLPATIVGLALCFAILALPVTRAESSSTLLQATQAATVDACNPEPAVIGYVEDNLYVLDQPGESGVPLIKILKSDRVEVLGRNKNGFWLAIKTYAGIVGWAPSPHILVDKKFFNNPTSVPIMDGALPQPTEAATMEAGATEDASAANGDCPAIDATITATAFELQIAPLTNSGSAGKRVKVGDHVTILALNASGSWAKVQADTGEIGWISTAYTALPVGRLSRVKKDYSSVEQTLTPRP